jgi:hypothetical protein
MGVIDCPVDATPDTAGTRADGDFLYGAELREKADNSGLARQAGEHGKQRLVLAGIQAAS